MIVRNDLDISTSGPWVIRTCVAFGVLGLTWEAIGSEESKMPAITVIASLRGSLFIYRP
jgi:hypothetical protein